MYAAISFYFSTQDGRLDVVANDAGDRTTPAYVGINEGEILVGESAKQLCGRKPALVVKNNKKILSLTDSDVSTSNFYPCSSPSNRISRQLPTPHHSPVKNTSVVFTLPFQ